MTSNPNQNQIQKQKPTRLTELLPSFDLDSESTPIINQQPVKTVTFQPTGILKNNNHPLGPAARMSQFNSNAVEPPPLPLLEQRKSMKNQLLNVHQSSQAQLQSKIDQLPVQENQRNQSKGKYNSQLLQQQIAQKRQSQAQQQQQQQRQINFESIQERRFTQFIQNPIIIPDTVSEKSMEDQYENDLDITFARSHKDSSSSDQSIGPRRSRTSSYGRGSKQSDTFKMTGFNSNFGMSRQQVDKFMKQIQKYEEPVFIKNLKLSINKDKKYSFEQIKEIEQQIQIENNNIDDASLINLQLLSDKNRQEGELLQKLYNEFKEVGIGEVVEKAMYASNILRNSLENRVIDLVSMNEFSNSHYENMHLVMQQSIDIDEQIKILEKQLKESQKEDEQYQELVEIQQAIENELNNIKSISLIHPFYLDQQNIDMHINLDQLIPEPKKQQNLGSYDVTLKLDKQNQIIALQKSKQSGLELFQLDEFQNLKQKSIDVFLNQLIIKTNEQIAKQLQ